MCDINKKPTLGLILISLIITFIEIWNGRVMCAIKKNNILFNFDIIDKCI